MPEIGREDDFRFIEASKDLLKADLEEVKRILNKEREKNANLKDMLDGMAHDMGIMEVQIAQLADEVEFLRRNND